MMKNEQQLPQALTVSESWLQFIESLPKSDKELVMQVFSNLQEHIFETISFSEENGLNLLKELKEVDQFFNAKGGISLYQKLLHQTAFPAPFNYKIHSANGIDIGGACEKHFSAIMEALISLPKMAEVYAIGGAADRLNLMRFGKMLPAACLKIGSKNLLEYLFLDLQAKEWLYYKIFKKTITLPVVMMTSLEKDNQAHIYDILDNCNYFDRPKESITIFHQPQVPMVDRSLKWQATSKGLFLKPGGHGVIWNLCQNLGVFEELKNQGIKKLSVRQINNPIACVDFGHLAFLGYGFASDAHFGCFATERFAGSQEGINVVLEDEKKRFCLTNIEYTQLKQAGIDDVADKKGLSSFPANTNVLFIDLKTLDEQTHANPFPGKILNFKSFEINGQKVDCARLETTMQNIADGICESNLHLKKSYMTLSKRYKTISPTKKQKIPGGSYDETPEACFYDFMKNAQDLFAISHIKHKPLDVIQNYFFNPSFVFLYNPSLGPLFSIIAQKISKGELKDQAYLEIQVPEVKMEDFMIDGALKITAAHPFGKIDPKARKFTSHVPRVKLKNCRFINAGLDKENLASFYVSEPMFLEKAHIHLEGFSEFEAEGIDFKGNFLINVPDGFKVKAFVNAENEIVFEKVKLNLPSWEYQYIMGKDRFLLQESNP
jgi:UDP-N-acetylglucosamine pyrophosphorylase